jgi:hypothetical protein
MAALVAGTEPCDDGILFKEGSFDIPVASKG